MFQNGRQANRVSLSRYFCFCKIQIDAFFIGGLILSSHLKQVPDGWNWALPSIVHVVRIRERQEIEMTIMARRPFATQNVILDREEEEEGSVFHQYIPPRHTEQTSLDTTYPELLFTKFVNKSCERCVCVCVN